MDINAGNLSILTTSFNAAYQRGLGQADADHERISTEMPSMSSTELYNWLGEMPNVRQWIGDRVIQNFSDKNYSVKNLPFELTIGVDRDDIHDDTYGKYGPLFEQMGNSTSAFACIETYNLLKNGFATACYDDQFFFDTDHPVLDADGVETSVSNFGGGAGTPWFVLDTSRPLKPLIRQKRKDWQFVAMDAPTDENVFYKKKFVYGVDSRMAFAYGFWQMAYGSKDTLNAANYAAAVQALEEMKGDYARPMGIKPNLLVVPPSLKSAGLELLNAERNAAGATNVWKGTAELMSSPWLA